MKDVILSANNLTRQHPDRESWLLRGCSLEVHRGDSLCLTGPLGSGKSLLLRALCLLDPCDAGEVLFHDKPVTRVEVAPFRRQVVYLHQRPAVWEVTVEECLREPFTFKARRGATFDGELALRLLSGFGRDASFLHRFCRDLSGGELQIVALARAMQVDPVVLLLDEPTSAMDLEAARSAERIVMDWLSARPEERAAVWVSHDPQLRQRVANREIGMRFGQILPID